MIGVNSMTIAEANRDGTIWRAYSFKDVMLTQIAGLGTLNYTSNEAQTIDVTFRSDYWEEILATGMENTNDYTEQSIGTAELSNIGTKNTAGRTKIPSGNHKA